MDDPFSALMPSNSMGAATQWVEETMTGSLAVSVAVIAVAATGLAMFSGRLDLRKAATVIMGCFVLFGSAGVAKGLLNLATGQAPILADEQGSPEPMKRSPPLSGSTAPQQFDPYAGAAMPVQ